MKDIELVTSFAEDNYDAFQLWLEDIHEIEGSEAEVILGNLVAKQIDHEGTVFEVYKVVGHVAVMWTKDEDEVIRAYHSQRRIHSGDEPFYFEAEIVEVEKAYYDNMPSTSYVWRKDLLD